MLPIKFIACVGAAGTGTGVLAGGAYYLIASQDGYSKKTYLLIAKELENTTKKNIKTTCINNQTCSIFKSNQVFSFYESSEDKQELKPTFTKIKKHQDIHKNHQYVLQIDALILEEQDLIEIEFTGSKKALFEVSTEAVLETNKKIKPTLPKNILPIEDLKRVTKDLTFDKLTAKQQRSRKFHIDQYPTKIQRSEIDHDNFLIINWDPDEDANQAYSSWTYSDKSKVDKFLFKPFADQKNDQIDHSYIRLELNNKDRDERGWMEIYEIKDQEKLTDAFNKEKTKNTNTSFKPDNLDLSSFSEDDVLVTKLTALEKGKYYKFVFENFDKFKEDFKDKFSSLVLKKVAGELTQKILELTSDTSTTSKHVCLYISDDSEASKCKFWNTPVKTNPSSDSSTPQE